MSSRLFRARPARVVPAVIVAIAFLAIAVALGWFAIAAIAADGTAGATLSAGYSGLADAGAARWGTVTVIAVGIAVALLGLILMIAGISPGAKRFLGYRAETPAHLGRFEVVLPTSALSNLAAAAADTVDGVSSVRAASNASSTIISFSTPIRDNDDIRDGVDAAVSQRFAQISFDRTPKVKVRALRRQS